MMSLTSCKTVLSAWAGDWWNLPAALGTGLGFLAEQPNVGIVGLIVIFFGLAKHAVDVYSKIMDEKRKQERHKQEMRQDEENHKKNLED